MLDVLKSLDEEKKAEKEVVSAGKFTHLTKAIKQWMSAWPAQSSETDTLRASGMYYVCPREFVFNYWQPVPNKNFDWISSIRMSLGTYLHSYLQNYVLGPMGVLWGKWLPRFDAIGDLTEGFHPDPGLSILEIQQQRELSWTYLEKRVWHEQLRISGHMDGQVSAERIAWILDNEKLFKSDPVEACNRLQKIDANSLCLLEIKTTGKFQFDSLRSVVDIPDYYKMQACIYQHLSGIKDTVFWYIERDTLDSKTFVYSFERGWWNDAVRKAKVIWQYIKDERLPEVGMACKLPTDKRAKKCAFCKACFRSDFDFARYVAAGKELAEKSGRKLLDLSSWEYEGE